MHQLVLPSGEAGPGAAGRVAVLGGGRSSEHDVSLRSAASVADGLDPARFEAVRITISRDGQKNGSGNLVAKGGGLTSVPVSVTVEAASADTLAIDESGAAHS